MYNKKEFELLKTCPILSLFLTVNFKCENWINILNAY